MLRLANVRENTSFEPADYKHPCKVTASVMSASRGPAPVALPTEGTSVETLGGNWWSMRGNPP
jgi:hypothetical protein